MESPRRCVGIDNDMNSEQLDDIYKYYSPYHRTFFFHFPEIPITIKLSLAITIVTQMREQKRRWEP